VSVVVAVVFWFVVVPNWRPPLHDGERYGVDVSAHQGKIDWRQVAADDIDFAYIKASEGGGFTDSRYRENWTGAGEAGLDRGAYHFFTLCRPGEEQARHFLAVAPPDPRALAPAVDLELAGNCSRRPAASEVEAELATFLEIVDAAWGQPALVYVRDDWENRYPVRTRLDRPLWQFRFLRRPNLEDVRVWQIHGFAHVEGILGRVDLNIMRPADHD
jgi:lysozyme